MGQRRETQSAACHRDGHPTDRREVGIKHRGAVAGLEDGQVIDVGSASEGGKRRNVELAEDPSPSSSTDPPPT